MRRTLLATTGAVLSVLTLLTTAAAAAPATSVTDETSGVVGPPGGLPEQVPDFVADVLDAVGQFVNGLMEENPDEEVSGSAGDGVDG